MQEHIYLLTIILPLVTVLIIFAMRYGSAALQARAVLAKQETLRQVSITASSAQVETAAALVSIQLALSDLSARLVTIERILKDVE